VSGVRELKHPTVEIEDDDGGLRLRFYVPGSKFGAIEVVLDLDEADDFIASLEQAIAFALAGLSEGKTP
jgi:hypothetical protein